MADWLQQGSCAGPPHAQARARPEPLPAASNERVQVGSKTLHQTHRIMVGSGKLEGMYWCACCGCYAKQRAKKLAKPCCGGADKAAQARLKRLRSGEHPAATTMRARQRCEQRACGAGVERFIEHSPPRQARAARAQPATRPRKRVACSQRVDDEADGEEGQMQTAEAAAAAEDEDAEAEAAVAMGNSGGFCSAKAVMAWREG